MAGMITLILLVFGFVLFVLAGVRSAESDAVQSDRFRAGLLRAGGDSEPGFVATLNQVLSSEHQARRPFRPTG